MPWASTKVYPCCFLSMSQKGWAFLFIVKIFRRFLVLRNRGENAHGFYMVFMITLVSYLKMNDKSLQLPWGGKPCPNNIGLLKCSAFTLLHLLLALWGVGLLWIQEGSYLLLHWTLGWSVMLRFSLIPTAVAFSNWPLADSSLIGFLWLPQCMRIFP